MEDNIVSPKRDWLEQLPLVPFSFVKIVKVFVTNASNKRAS